METPIAFELRYAAHQQRVARINAEDWKQQALGGPLGRLRAMLASLRSLLSRRPNPAPCPIGGATA